jgi:hypothetical protein
MIIDVGVIFKGYQHRGGRNRGGRLSALILLGYQL